MGMETGGWPNDGRDEYDDINGGDYHTGAEDSGDAYGYDDLPPVTDGLQSDGSFVQTIHEEGDGYTSVTRMTSVPGEGGYLTVIGPEDTTDLGPPQPGESRIFTGGVSIIIGSDRSVTYIQPGEADTASGDTDTPD